MTDAAFELDTDISQTGSFFVVSLRCLCASSGELDCILLCNLINFSELISMIQETVCECACVLWEI